MENSEVGDLDLAVFFHRVFGEVQDDYNFYFGPVVVDTSDSDIEIRDGIVHMARVKVRSKIQETFVYKLALKVSSVLNLPEPFVSSFDLDLPEEVFNKIVQGGEDVNSVKYKINKQLVTNK